MGIKRRVRHGSFSLSLFFKDFIYLLDRERERELKRREQQAPQ